MTRIDLEEDLEYYSKSKPTPKNRMPLIIGITVAVLAVAAVLFSPLFWIKTITVNGISHYTQAEILEKAGISTGDHILFFSRFHAKDVLLEDPYIADVQFSVQLPDTLVIDISERKVRGYVPYMNSYLYIDEYGRVLDVQESYYEAQPLVEGLQFDHFQLGEILPVENEEALQVMVLYSQMIIKYELSDLVVQLDVSDPNDVYAKINRVEIHLGGTSDCDQKVRMMAEIMKTIPEEDRGKLDLSDLSKPIVFQYLT